MVVSIMLPIFCFIVIFFSSWENFVYIVFAVVLGMCVCCPAAILGVISWFLCCVMKFRQLICRLSTQRFDLQVPGGRFKNTYELLNLRALKFSPVEKIYIFQCMGKIFCVEFEMEPLKFHTKYLTLTLIWRIWFLYIKILRALIFRSSYTFFTRPPDI